MTMKICNSCGCANEDSSFICEDCGAMLPDAPSEGGKKKGGSLNIPKPILIAVAAVLVIALIAGGILLFTPSKKTELADAFRNTVGELDDQTQFRQFFQRAGTYLEEGDYSLSAAFSGTGVDVSLDANYSRRDKLVQGSLKLMGFGLDYSADNKIVQVRFPGEYEVYGFQISDINEITETFNKVFNMPLISQLMPFNLPTDLKLDLFQKTGLKDVVMSIAGEEYTALVESIQVEEWNGESLIVNGRNRDFDVYKITWKSSAMNNFLGALGSGGLLPNVGELVNALLPELDPYVYCYVDEGGYLSGARFTLSGKKCFLLLEGKENLWDSVSLTVESVSGETIVCRGGTQKNGTVERTYLSDGTKDVFEILYDDATGEFSLTTASLGELLRGKANVDGREARVYVTWELPDVGMQSLKISLGELQAEPAHLGEHYADLKSKAWSVIENVIIDWITNFKPAA